MGVEPTGDRAERPPSRFEDGETHRSPYTSIATPCIVSCLFGLVKLVLEQLPAGEHQHGCENGSHDTIRNDFAELAAHEDAWK